MTDPSQRKRKPPVSYRPPKHLRDEFERLVARSGLSAGAFITQAVFGNAAPQQRRRPAVEAQALARLLGPLGEIRTRLDDILLAGAAGAALPIEEALAELTEMRSAIFSALGRKP